jgi:ribosomal protein S18 acetylase RimI-like enzyme
VYSDVTDTRLLRLLEPNDALREAVVRAGGEVYRIGPFEAYLHPDPHALGFEYAQPIEPLPARHEIVTSLRHLKDLFAGRALPLSIEFNTPLFPGLADILEAEGLALSDREPLLVLDPSGFTPSRKTGVEVRFLQADDADATLSAFARIFSEVLLEKPYAEAAQAVTRLRTEIERSGGNSHALAWLAGAPVGTGFISVLDDVAEITRVATVPSARRRGVAATLTSSMLESAFASGARVAWLTAAGRPAQALYENLGFRLAGERLYYSPESG